MCGISGIYHRNYESVDQDTLIRMTRTLNHRGPDEEGFFVNTGKLEERNDGMMEGVPEYPPLRGSIPHGRGNVGLGHRRLSIIDLSSGRQPLSNEDGTVWIAFNGEIYISAAARLTLLFPLKRANFQQSVAVLFGNVSSCR